LPAVAERVARFSPDAVDGCDAPLAWQDDEYGERVPWALRLLGARSTGPVIEVWKPR